VYSLQRFLQHFTYVNELRQDNAEKAARIAELRTEMQRGEEARHVVKAESDRLRQRLAKLEQANEDLREQVEELKSRPSPTWVPPGHFYSPLVDPGEDFVDLALTEEAEPTATPDQLGLDEELMISWFDAISATYLAFPFPEKHTAGRLYYYANPHFPLADALALLTFFRNKAPVKYVEIGCGFSTCAAMDANEHFLRGKVEMTLVEPFPDLLLNLIGEQCPPRFRLIRSKLQAVPVEEFTKLEAGDILFIDSSHVGKTGSDVVHYLFHILPRLRPGVLIHIHDIFYPFEYPRAWVVNENRSWNEAYLLRAFLSGNLHFRVLYSSDFFFKCRRNLVAAKMPLCIEHRGGSLWLEKVNAPRSI